MTIVGVVQNWHLLHHKEVIKWPGGQSDNRLPAVFNDNIPSAQIGDNQLGELPIEVTIAAVWFGPPRLLEE